jgi:Na+/H+ antiporter NhaD/arsenite permease-like protein
MIPRTLPFGLPVFVLLGWILLGCVCCQLLAAPAETARVFPLPLDSYQDDDLESVPAQLINRIQKEPLNLVATLLFFCAIVHTFLASKFMRISHGYQDKFEALEEAAKDPQNEAVQLEDTDKLQFKAQLFHFLGEVEAIFGIWLIPLFVAIVAAKGWQAMENYVGHVNVAEAIFVVVVMAIASSRPILRLAENWIARVAGLGRGTPAAWWLAILTIGPLLGSFITEPAAMTICALLLRHRFYNLRPSDRLKYGTLGLLFVNISVGGTLSHFAAPPVVVVAAAWNWDLSHMLFNFGWKAAVGVVISNVIYFLFFRKELASLRRERQEEIEVDDHDRPIPAFITIIHLIFVALVVVTAHYSTLVILIFLFFLAFVSATRPHQHRTALRPPLLVGFFLAALFIHGGCQQWWISPVLGGLSEWPLMIGATILTAFNDNAAITYLASLVPDFSDDLKYAVMAGAVTGGGLTVIANAPNPAGQSILASRFGENGISPLGLFLGAIGPTLVMGAVFMLLR